MLFSVAVPLELVDVEPDEFARRKRAELGLPVRARRGRLRDGARCGLLRARQRLCRPPNHKRSQRNGAHTAALETFIGPSSGGANYTAGTRLIPAQLRLDDDFDGAVELLPEVAQRVRQLVQREGMRVQRRRVELLLRDQRRPRGGPRSVLAANPIQSRCCWSRCDRRRRSAGLFENAPRQTRPPRFSIWIASLTALGAPEHSKTRFTPRPVRQRRRTASTTGSVDALIDNVGAYARADRKAAVDDVGEDHRAGAERFADRDGGQADWPCACDNEAFSSDRVRPRTSSAASRCRPSRSTSRLRR